LSSSIKRILSSRANGARSKGPVTESGKQISAQNARKHGLLAKIVVLKNESKPGFAETMAEHLERFQPADAVEYGIVEEMVAAHWQLRRSWSIETKTLDECFRPEECPDGTSSLAALFRNATDAHGLENSGEHSGADRK